MSGVIKKGKIYTREIIVKDIDADQFPMEYMKHVPEEKQERKVKYIHFHNKKHNVTKTGIEVNKLLNLIYIFKQLELPIPETDKREIYYFIRELLGGVLDIKVKKIEDRYTNVEVGKVDYYLKKLFNTLTKEDPESYPYWGFVQDYLGILSKEIVEVYDKYMNVSLLNEDAIKKISETPFFLIICEKQSTLKAFMKEFINRGYGKNYDFYGINLGKQPTIPAVKLLIELSKIRNFHAFCMHDLDINGIEIFFDMKRHFNIVSIGINPEFLEYIGVNFDDIKELWEPKGGKKTRETLIKIARTVLNDLDISEEQYKIYSNWIDFCSEERAELNSLTAYRLKEDMVKSKARDFCNYFEKLMKDCKWNLLRVRDFKKKDRITYLETKDGYEIVYEDESFRPSFRLSKTIDYNIKTELNRLSTYEPDFISKIYDKKEDSIITENEELDGIRSEITRLLNDGVRKITDKFDTIETDEYNMLNDRKDDILDEFKKDNPKLFDIDWDRLFDKKKMNEFNKIIRIKEKLIGLSNIKKYEILREGLMNYIGSIEKPIQPIFKNWFELVGFIGKTKRKGDIKVSRLKKIISGLLKRTEEYKEATEIIDGFGEFTDDIDYMFDKESSILEDIKEIIENMFKKIFEKLEEY